MIGLDLETQGETEQDGSEQGFRKPEFPIFCRFDRLGDRAVRSLSLPNGRTKPWPKRRAVCEITAASAQGRNAIACILVLCPTWMIWKLYEQYVMATAPPIARTLSTPNESINRKAPNKEMNSQLAGLFPFIRRLYNDCVQSPSLEGTNEVVGIPPNMESVQ